MLYQIELLLDNPMGSGGIEPIGNLYVYYASGFTDRHVEQNPYDA